jgi:hypothetical protein
MSQQLVERGGDGYRLLGDLPGLGRDRACACGCEIRKSGRAEHCRSKKHNDYIQSLVN